MLACKCQIVFLILLAHHKIFLIDVPPITRFAWERRLDALLGLKPQAIIQKKCWYHNFFYTSIVARHPLSTPKYAAMAAFVKNNPH
jgi:hypothetical protein